MRIRSFGGTDTGKKRANNEDAYLLNDGLRLYAVADGVGGNEGGEVASRITVETLAEVVPDMLGEQDRTPPSGDRSPVETGRAALEYAIILTNKKIREERAQRPALSNMGTTLTALLLLQGRVFIAHVGDSRAYLFRAGELKQLTNDHSFVEEQVRAGTLTVEQARISPYRHVITRALGIDEEVETDFTALSLKKDDRFLLCTDGLTEMVSDVEISRVLAASEPRDAVRKLIAAANNAGGVDNITAVALWVKEV
jgi:protein phosphatase